MNAAGTIVFPSFVADCCQVGKLHLVDLAGSEKAEREL